MEQDREAERLNGLAPLEEMVELYKFDFTPNPTIRTANTRTKRKLDNLIASIGLIATAPVIAIAALAIKLESKGPFFYKEKRITENGKIFYIFKLRTMYTNHNTAQRGEYNVEGYRSLDDVLGVQNPNDIRITRIGRILRRFSIDELLQFLNVLRGEMSIVGIRPLEYEEAQRFIDYSLSTGNQSYLQIFYCPSGMTSLAAIHGRSKLPKDRRIEYDLEYAIDFNTRDIVPLDLQIMKKTLKCIITGEGAY